MAYDIGSKIGMEGEAEYRRALKDIDGSLKLLKAEMGAVTSEFIGNEKSIESLSKQNDVLKRTSDELKKKLAEQESQLSKVKDEYGENSTQAQNLQRQIYKTTAELNKNEAEIRKNDKALGDLKDGAKNAGDKIEDLGEEAEESEGKLKKFGDTLGTGLKAAAAAAGAAVAATGKALFDIVKQSIEASGELEQNLGGSEAVFGEYADRMQKTAKEAYNSMGLSATDFLATANRMGALFQGSGFEIEESADLSAAAMQRAADVASIMGIDLSSAMDAIAGAAKGNFTMMDNLGVAINDTTLKAYAQEKGLGDLSTTQKKVSAAMQLFLEKTEYAAGNYQKENETLAGSISTLKAAWNNFLSGVGDPKGLADAAVGAFDAVLKKAREMLPAVVQGLTGLVRELIPRIGPMVRELLPELVNSAVSLVRELSTALPDIISAIAEMLPDVVTGIVGVFPTLTSALVDGLVTLINSLTDNTDTIIPALIDGILGMVDALTDPGNLKAILVGIVRLAVALVVELGKKLPEIAVHLLTAIGNIAIALWEAVKEVFGPAADWFGELFGGAIERIESVFSPIINFFAAVWDKIKGVFSAVADFFGNAFESAKNTAQKKFEGIKSFMGEVWGNIKQTLAPVVEWIGARFGEAYEYAKKKFEPIKETMGQVWDNIKATFAPVGEWFSENFGWAVDGIKNAFNGIKEWAEGVWNDITSAFKTGDFLTIGKNIVEGLWNGIKGAWDWLKKQVSGLIDGLIGGVKDMLGIHSPSKVFEEIGTDTIEGFEIGFTNRFSKFEKKAVEKVEDFTFFVKKEFDKLASYRGDAYAAWAMEQESLSWEESTKRTNEAAKEIRRIAEEMAGYDGEKKVIERGGVRWIIEGDTLRKADFGDLSEFAFKPLFEETIEEAAEEMAEAITEVVKEVFIPENINNMTKEDFRRWREDGFATAETVVRTPVTSAPVTGSGTTGSGALDQVLAAIRDLPTIPERIIVETNIDGERVATAIWNPLNAVAEQKGQPIINEA